MFEVVGRVPVMDGVLRWTLTYVMPHRAVELKDSIERFQRAQITPVMECDTVCSLN